MSAVNYVAYGIGTFLNVFGIQNKQDAPSTNVPTQVKNDWEAIASDWIAVTSDFRTAIEQQKKQTPV